jgi:hypothetical protein
VSVVELDGSGRLTLTVSDAPCCSLVLLGGLSAPWLL